MYILTSSWSVICSMVSLESQALRHWELNLETVWRLLNKFLPVFLCCYCDYFFLSAAHCLPDGRQVTTAASQSALTGCFTRHGANLYQCSVRCCRIIKVIMYFPFLPVQCGSCACCALSVWTAVSPRWGEWCMAKVSGTLNVRFVVFQASPFLTQIARDYLVPWV